MKRPSRPPKLVHIPGIVALFLVSMLCVSPTRATSNAPPPPVQPAVVGGSLAQEGEFPWIAALRYQNEEQPFCGGSLIAEQWVLTAAHCVTNSWTEQPQRPDELEVSLGTLVPARAGSGQRIGVTRIVVHPGYSRKTLMNDIALLRLNGVANLANENIETITLATVKEETELALPGTISIVAGWGATQPNGSDYARALRKASVPIVPDEVCIGTGGGHSDINICAGGEIGVDSCFGDSGGPLVVPGLAKGSYVLVGLTSYGIMPNCAETGIPGVYTRVAWYDTWINHTIQPQAFTDVYLPFVTAVSEE